MTRQKSFKTRVRVRMEKTGESYSSARRRLLDKSVGEALFQEDPGATHSAPDTEGPALGATERSTRRMSDTALRERTNRTWTEWFAILDAWDATAHSHPEIARWLVHEHGIGMWWAQTITVGYEQERGLREPAQVCGGEFAASASKTVNVPVERLTEAFTDDRLREQWLPGAGLTIRTARPGKSVTADWDGGGRLAVYFTAAGTTKSRLSLQHLRLPDAKTAEAHKAFWRRAVAELKTVLET